MPELDSNKYPNIQELINEGFKKEDLDSLYKYDQDLTQGLTLLESHLTDDQIQLRKDNFKLQKLEEFAEHKEIRDYIVKKYIQIDSTKDRTSRPILNVPDVPTYQGDRESLLDMNRTEFSNFLSAVNKLNNEKVEQHQIDNSGNQFAIKMLRYPAIASLYNKSKITVLDLQEGHHQGGLSNQLIHGKKNHLVATEEKLIVDQEKQVEIEAKAQNTGSSKLETKAENLTPEQTLQNESKQKLYDIKDMDIQNPDPKTSATKLHKSETKEIDLGSIQQSINDLLDSDEFTQLTDNKFHKNTIDWSDVVNNLQDPLFKARHIETDDVDAAKIMLEGIEKIQNIVSEIDLSKENKVFSTKVQEFLGAAAQVCKECITGGGKITPESKAKLTLTKSLLFKDESKIKAAHKSIVDDKIDKIASDTPY